MTKRDKLLVLLGIFFFLLINYPILQIFNVAALLGEIPLLTFSLFGIWLIAIVALYFFRRGLTSHD